MANTYDFYKPRLGSEYPEVDGPLSITAYITSLDNSYARYREKVAKALNSSSSDSPSADPKATTSLADFDYPIFHSPYGKLVQKGHARLLYNDFLSAPSAPEFLTLPNQEELLAIPYAASITDKTLEKTFMNLAKARYVATVEPSMHCAKRCGNMYTVSLYGGLASLVSSVEPSTLKGKRISMFAYGGGCASSFYAIHVKGDTTEIRDKMDLINRLASMDVMPCEEYIAAMKVS